MVARARGREEISHKNGFASCRVARSWLVYLFVGLLSLLVTVPTDAAPDGDGDGFTAAVDCDDDDPTTYPGAPQLCDGINNDCDDPNWPAPGPDETDDDLDGLAECEGDCNDADPTAFGGLEICDGFDNDCDGVVPADEFDLDGDGVVGCLGDNCPTMFDTPQPSFRLSRSLSSNENVYDYVIGSDGATAVYEVFVSQAGDDDRELYAVSTAGGPSTLLDVRDDDFADQTDLRVSMSPDGTTVVYEHYQFWEGSGDYFSVFSIPVSGGVPTVIIDQFDFSPSAKVTPDSTQVVYMDWWNDMAITSQPLSGGSPFVISDPSAVYGAPRRFILTSDSARVVYRTHQGALASALLNGGTPVVLELGPVNPNYWISADNAHVVFTIGNAELYSVPIVGGTPVRLDGGLAPGGLVDEVRLSPDGARVVYLADQDTFNVKELYAVSITGGTPVKLNGALPIGGDVESGFEITANSTHVVYSADQDTNDIREIYVVPIIGGTPVKLNDTLGQDATISYFRLGPDGNRVVYLADHETDGVGELYSVPALGGTVVKLNAPIVPGGQITDFVISPSGQAVAYRGDVIADTAFELFSVSITGGTPFRRNIPVPANHGVQDVAPWSWRWSPVDDTVFYLGDVEYPDPSGLYRSSTPAPDGDADGSGDACDCASSDDQLWMVPEDVSGLVFANPQNLAWTAVSDWGATTSGNYDTVRSANAADFTSAAVCVETDDGTDTTAQVNGTPPPSTVFYYLVRAENACGGTVGADSSGIPRNAAACP